MLDRLTCPQQLCGRPNNSPNLGRQPVSAWHVCPIVGHQQKSWPKKWSHPGYRHPLNVFWSEVISLSLPQARPDGLDAFEKLIFLQMVPYGH